jgi:hypothetical protein
LSIGSLFKKKSLSSTCAYCKKIQPASWSA